MLRALVASAFFGAILATTVVPSAAAPEVGPTPPPPKSAGSARPFIVALSVTDIDASTKWYVETLGFRVRYPTIGHNKPLRTTLELDGFYLSLISVDHPTDRNSVLPNPLDPASLTGIYRFGVEVPDVDAVLKPLRQQGQILRTQVDGGWGIRWCELEDPDGNRVWVVQRLALPTR
jgi:catechol 2,3-dioxygenase-like lactoylglutathione lyase family enzyme